MPWHESTKMPVWNVNHVIDTNWKTMGKWC